MKGEDLRRAVGTVNDPPRLLKGSQDMVPRVRLPGFRAAESVARRRPPAPRFRNLATLADRRPEDDRPVLEANTSGSISRVGPFDRMTARSRTFSSSRMFPGQE